MYSERAGLMYAFIGTLWATLLEHFHTIEKVLKCVEVFKSVVWYVFTYVILLLLFFFYFWLYQFMQLNVARYPNHVCCEDDVPLTHWPFRTQVLTHCSLMMANSIIELCHQWFQQWLCACFDTAMMSSNGTIFYITSPLCREFTSHRWIPLTKASDAELWSFLWSALEQTVQ